MSSLFSRHGDAILWVALGALGFYMAINAADHLTAVRKASRVKRNDSQPEIISQRTEDAIKPETLRKLIASSTYEIRQAAIKIIIERVARNHVYTILLSTVKQPTPQTPFSPSEAQAQALASLRFLSTSIAQETTFTRATLRAVLSFLESALDVAKIRPHKPYTDYLHRTPAERDALETLGNICRIVLADSTLATSLVQTWLGKYPFGGVDAVPARRRLVVHQLNTGQTDDARLAGIVMQVLSRPAGRRAMREAGLVTSAFEEHEDGCVTGYVGATLDRTIDAYEDQWREFGLSGEEPTARVREESPEEMALRRRRRMAMVINEGGGPLGSANIYDGARGGEWRS